MDCLLGIGIMFLYAVFGGVAFKGFQKNGWDCEGSIIFSIFWPVVLPVWLGLTIGNKLFK